MSERTIDPTRQVGEDIAPKGATAAPEMSYEEAVEYDALFRWRVLPTKGDQARAACIREVERLQAEMAGDRELTLRQANAWAQAYRDIAAELARFRAALPAIIGCAAGDPATCTRDENGWYPCCRSRLAAVKHGLLPQPERHDEPDDAA